MKLTNRTSLQIVLFMTVAFPCVSHAQKSATPVSLPSTSTVNNIQDDDLRAQQEIIAELKFLRDDNKAKADEILAKAGQIVTLTRMNEIERERGDFYKDAATKGIKLDSGNGIIVTTLQDQVKVCEARNIGLEKENSGLRSSRNLRTVFGAVGGAIFSAYAIHK